MRCVVALLLAVGCSSPSTMPRDAIPADDAAVDAVIDTPADAAMAAVVSTGHAHDTGVSGLTFPVVIPANGTLVVIAVEIGSNPTDTSVPSVTSVKLGAQPLVQKATIVGTPAYPALSRSEQWYVQPAPGTSTVDVTLSAAAASLHAEAVVFTGVTAAGTSYAVSGASSQITNGAPCYPAPHKLFFNSVGANVTIPASGGANVEMILVDNAGTATTLDNSGVGLMPSCNGSSMQIGWVLGVQAQWQSILTALY